MASSKRRRFSAQFKAEAVQLVVQDDRAIVEVARELQINPGTLGNWVLKYRQQSRAQYSAGAFTGYCQAHGFRQSMGRTGGAGATPLPNRSSRV